MNLCLRITSSSKEFFSRLFYSWEHQSYAYKTSIALTVSLVGLSMISAALISFVGFLGLDGLFDCARFVYNFAWYVREFSLLFTLSSRGLALAFLLIGIILLVGGLFLIPYKTQLNNESVSNIF